MAAARPPVLPTPKAPGLAAVPPFGGRWIPDGYRGPVALPGTGRIVWWTGRVAIGLRYPSPLR